MHPRFLLNILRRRPISLACALLSVVVTALLVSLDVGTLVLAWGLTSVVVLGLWHKTERMILRAAKCRPLSAREKDTLSPRVSGSTAEVLIVDRAEPWVVRGLRSVVVGAGMLDVLDEHQLGGLITHRALLDPAPVAGELVVWIGMLPFRIGWHVNLWIGVIGRALALLIGTSLLVPLVIWPQGYLRWGGRLFGALLGGMFASLLLSGGMALAGLVLMTSWFVVPVVQCLLEWESRRAERMADDAVLEAGLGWELLGALDELVCLDPQPVPPGLLGWLYRAGAPLRDRADRLLRALLQSPEP